MVGWGGCCGCQGILILINGAWYCIHFVLMAHPNNTVNNKWCLPTVRGRLAMSYSDWTITGNLATYSYRLTNDTMDTILTLLYVYGHIYDIVTSIQISSELQPCYQMKQWSTTIIMLNLCRSNYLHKVVFLSIICPGEPPHPCTTCITTSPVEGTDCIC